MMIQLSRPQKEALSEKLQTYFSDELDQEIEPFDAEFLLDFITAEMGPILYNKGVMDARTHLMKKLEFISESFYEIELPSSI